MKTSEMRAKTCCFTGHRTLPVLQRKRIAQRTAEEIRKLVKEKGVRYFGVGGAIGYDTLAAEVLFRLRETEFPHIKIILVYPFDGFTDPWTRKQKAAYKRMLTGYDKVVRVCLKACREAYLERNRHLVNNAAYCVAYWTGKSGGTAYTLRYAEKRGVEIINVANADRRK